MFLFMFGVRLKGYLLTYLLTYLYEVRIFSVFENGENGLSDEGADGGSAPPPEF